MWKRRSTQMNIEPSTPPLNALLLICVDHIRDIALATVQPFAVSTIVLYADQGWIHLVESM